MKKEKVLLVEDAPDMQMIVRTTLGAVCDLTCVASIAEGKNILRENEFSLILLDVNLPDGSGFDLCRQLREQKESKNTPIFFLTGERQVDQRVLGFDIGADDYITKPFEPNEFRARVIAKLKRHQASASMTSFTQGVFHIDWPKQKAFLKKGAQQTELSLTPIEFKLLVQFLRHEGRIFSREELLIAVWGSSVHVSEHTVDTHISSMRKKIGEFGNCFRAVVKKGYCFSMNEKVGKRGA